MLDQGCESSSSAVLGVMTARLLLLNRTANFTVEALASGALRKFGACEPVLRRSNATHREANARRARVMSVFCSVLCVGGGGTRLKIDTCSPAT